MSAPPRFLSPFVRTRTRLTLSLGLLVATLTAALLPWWLPDDPSASRADRATGARQAGTGPRDEAAAQAEARRTGKQVLVDTATTPTSLTWARPDGQMRTQLSATPRRAKNDEGEWAAIDTRLRRTDTADGLGIRPANPAAPVRFADGTRGGTRAERSFARAPLMDAQAEGSVLAEMDVAGHTLTYTWPGTLPEPVLDGPRALYPEVLPGVDLLLVAREEGGFAQLLIVKTKEAARNKALATVSYGLRSDTAVFRHDESAGRVLVLDKDGKEIGSIPTPFAWDSGGRDPELPQPEAEPRTSVATSADVLKLSGLSGIEPGARSAPLPLRLTGDETGSARLELDVAKTGLLTAADVTYPLFVDPTATTGWAAWTTAYKPYPNTSFWNGTNFSSGTSDARVGHEDDTGGTGRSFWRMDFKSSIKGADVTSAYFKVLNNHSWSCTDRQFQLWLTGGISTGTTWNKQPSWSSEIQRKSFAHGWSSSCPDAYESFTVTSAAQKGADGGWSSITFGMRASSESDTQTWRKFRATSATLEVNYNRPPNEPTDGKSSPGGNCVVGGTGVTVGKTVITLSANATDADDNLSKLRFRFWVNGDTATRKEYLVTPNDNGTASQSIPVDFPLTDKTTYAWDVRAEDSGGLVSTFHPPGTTPCIVTVDGSGPAQPEVASTDFPQATSDGTTWTKVKFGSTGSVTFTSSGAKKFKYAFEGLGYKEIPADSNGVATVPDLRPEHAGPTRLNVYAYDQYGNPSVRTDYNMYVPPRDKADGPGDTGGDDIPDILIINSSGYLYTCPGAPDGELFSCMVSSYTADDSGETRLNPAGHWYDPATDKAALITHYDDAYPGDGATDLFAVSPDGGFWLYPGDGYGSFNVDKRLSIRLPSNAPAPSTWTQIKAVGDITGDKHPDLVLRAGAAFWTLSGYTGASFETATLMNDDAWARRDIVNVADINGDSTADLLWRNLDNGNMYVRHGKPGTEGGVDLESLKLAANSLNGDVSYGTSWTESNVSTALGIPDVNGDDIPDIWARFGGDGQTRVYHPSRTNTGSPVKIVLSTDWSTMKALG